MTSPVLTGSSCNLTSAAAARAGGSNLSLSTTPTSSTQSAVYVLAVVLGTTALFFAAACLVFNFVLRSNRIIKMSSPRLNIVIASGGILASVCCASYGMDYFLDDSPKFADIICQVRPASLAISFSLIYGPMIGKTWRVNQIFRLAGAKRVVIKDVRLLMLTSVLLVLDVVVILLWRFLDPLKFAWLILVHETVGGANPTLFISDITLVTSCQSQWYLLWVGAFISYKLPFLFFGLREAWWMRGMLLPNINDSMCVVVSSLATLSVATTYFIVFVVFRSWPTVIGACAVVGLWICIIMAIGFVFIPKLILWKRTPKGRVTRVSISSTGSSMAVLQSFEHLEAELTNANTEIETLRDFIKQKEMDVEKLQTLLTNAENSLAQINFGQDLTPPPGLEPMDLNQSLNMDDLDVRCDVTSCCLHANRPVGEVYIPGDKGYIPAYALHPDHHYHQMKRRRYSTNDSLSGYSSSLSGSHYSHHRRGGYRLHPEQRYHDRPQPPPSLQHHDIGYPRRKNSNECGCDNENNAKVTFPCQNFARNNDDLDDEDDERLRQYYAQLRKRRRSSTPSIHSVASLSKLSRVRADLNDAMAISKQLRSGWSTDAEEDGKRDNRRRRSIDKQRRKTAIGIREITDSIMESYDFQRTFDNQSFVSECITPRSSEASYEMKKNNKNTMKSSPYNNLRKIRQRRRQKNENVVAISYSKNSNIYSGISDDTGDFGHEGSTDRVSKVTGEEVFCPATRPEDPSGRISPAAFYVTDREAGRITFIPAQNVNVLALRNQAVIGQSPSLAVITSDTLYPHAPNTESGSRPGIDRRDDLNVCDSVKGGGKTTWRDGEGVAGYADRTEAPRTRFPRCQSDNEIARRQRKDSYAYWDNGSDGYPGGNLDRADHETINNITYSEQPSASTSNVCDTRNNPKATFSHSANAVSKQTDNANCNSIYSSSSHFAGRQPVTTASNFRKNKGGILTKSSLSSASGTNKNSSPEQRRVMFNVPPDNQPPGSDLDTPHAVSKNSSRENTNISEGLRMPNSSRGLARTCSEGRNLNRLENKIGLRVMLSSEGQNGSLRPAYQIKTADGHHYVPGFVLDRVGKPQHCPSGSGHTREDSFA